VLYLKNLYIEAFRSIRDKQSINVGNLGKATRISGSNLDTGGDSGAGKTSVAEALDYLLGVSKIPSTVLKCRESSEPMEVSGEFLNEKNEEITITRNSKDGVKLSINGNLVEGLATVVEEKIDELISMPREIFRKMYHKKQKEGGFFLNLTPKDSYKFLTQACGLGDWQLKLEKIDNRVKELKKLVSDLEYQISIDTESLSDAAANAEVLTEPEKPIVEDNIEGAEAEIKKLKSAIEKLIAEKDKELSKLKAPNPTGNSYGPEIEALDAEIDAIEKEYSFLVRARQEKASKLKEIIRSNNSKIKEKESAISDLRYLREDMKKRVAELAMLKHTDCPTCSQPWDDPVKQDIIKEKKENLKRDKLKLDQLTETSEGLEDLVAKTQKANDALDELSSSVNNPKAEEMEALKLKKQEYQKKMANASQAYQAAYAVYSAEADKIKNGYNEKIETVKSKIQVLESSVSESRLKMEYYEKALARYKTEKKLAESVLKAKKEKVEKKKLELAAVNKEMDLTYESKKAIKSYNMKIFQETLDTIGYNASEILNQVPNVQNTSITFESFKEQKNGTIKEEITAFINNGKGQNIDVRSFSGGEETSINLAVDFAVIDVLEDKFNKGIDIFILDEPFNGLDDVSKEQYVELLKNINTNKKLFLIDHSSEVKEMISDTIVIEKSNDVSRIINV